MPSFRILLPILLTWSLQYTSGYLWYLVASFLAAVVGYIVSTYDHDYWRNRGVFSPPAWPLVGHILSVVLFKEQGGMCFKRIYDTYRNERFLGTHQFYQRTLVVRDPELIKRICVNDFQHFVDRGFFFNKEVDPLAGSVLFLRGTEWKKLRAKISPIFSPNKLRSMFPLIENTANEFVLRVRKLIEDDTDNINEYMKIEKVISKGLKKEQENEVAERGNQTTFDENSNMKQNGVAESENKTVNAESGKSEIPNEKEVKINGFGNKFTRNTVSNTTGEVLELNNNIREEKELIAKDNGNDNKYLDKNWQENDLFDVLGDKIVNRSIEDERELKIFNQNANINSQSKLVNKDNYNKTEELNRYTRCNAKQCRIDDQNIEPNNNQIHRNNNEIHQKDKDLQFKLSNIKKYIIKDQNIPNYIPNTPVEISKRRSQCDTSNDISKELPKDENHIQVDELQNGENFPENGEDLSENGGNLLKNGTQSPENSKNMPENGANLPEISKILTEIDAYSPKNDANLPDNGVNLPEYVINLPKSTENNEKHLKTSVKVLVDSEKLVGGYTADAIVPCAFGLKSNVMDNENDPFAVALHAFYEMSWFNIFEKTMRQFWPAFVLFFRMRIIPKKTHDFFHNIVTSVLRAREKGEQEKRGDFIDMMMTLRSDSANERNTNDDDANDVEITDMVISANAFIIFLGGFETTSSTLAFLLLELAANPGVQERLRAEVHQVLAKHHQNITYELLQEMTYMENVIQETLRLYPPFPSIQRMCTKDYRIPQSHAVVEKGTIVLFPTLGIHRDEQYFPAAGSFVPSRWERAQPPPGVYMPFGDGPRYCIGKRFALIQMKCCLIRLMQHVRFSPACETKRTEPFEADPRSPLTLHPADSRVKISLL